MRKQVGKVIVWGVAAAFIAVLALMADATSGTEPVQANEGHHFHGWCARTSSGGGLSFYHITHHDLNAALGPTLAARREYCEEEKDGGWMNNNTKNKLENGAEPGQFTFTKLNLYPTGWFERPSGGECDMLPNSGAILGSSNSTLAAQNRLEHVYALRTIELVLQVVYDIGSNEITGITGVVLGSLLGVSKVATYVTEWNYAMQDECQEILERGQIADIHVDTEQIVGDVKTILARVDVAVSTRATQTSVNAMDAKVVLISTALASLATSLTTETDAIDTALAKLKVQLLAETDEIDTALDELAKDLTNETDEIDTALDEVAKDLTNETDEIDTALDEVAKDLTNQTDEIDAALDLHDASLITETDELDAAVAKLKLQMLAGMDRNLRLYIEDHLETCSPVVSLFLDEPAGLLPLTVLVVAGLADLTEAEGLSIGSARTHLDRAYDSIAADDPRTAFQSLCVAYEQIVRGGGRG